jgi:hypothetical protein
MNTSKLPSFAASKLSKAILLIALPLVIGLAGCEFDRPEAEGRIYYELSFPFLEGNILENVFPTEMVLSFKDDRMTGEIRSLGGIMKTSFITDNDAKTIQQMLKNLS